MSTVETLKKENDSLRRAVDELVVLNDLAQNISWLRDAEEVTQAIIRKSVRAVSAEQGSITLIDRSADDSMKTLVRTRAGSDTEKTFHFNQILLGWMELHRTPLLLNDPAGDERFKGTEWDRSIHSLLSVPLMVKSELTGMLTVYNCRNDGSFTAEDQRLLSIIGISSAQVVEAARLYEEERSLKEELRRYADELEHRVDARTKELTEKNRELARTIQHLQETQQQLIQTEKMASLGQMTAGIAHEIRNPLNFVNNFAELTRESLAELEESLDRNSDVLPAIRDIRGNLDKIYQHGQRADAIVQGMMLHAKNEKGKPRPVSINVLLHEVVNITYHGMCARDDAFEVEVVTDYDPDLPKLDIVPHDMIRAFINVLLNAFQAAVEHGQGTNGSLSPTVWIKTSRSGNQVTTSIRDNGPGIPEDIQRKIFEPFFTTKPAGAGTGLGLSITYDIIVQRHRGQIEVLSDGEHGTECLIRLPVT